ncbi:MAG: hypothetical protein RLY14_2614 [Planctomycetota bacterium]|jgi:hypothetical protein
MPERCATGDSKQSPPSQVSNRQILFCHKTNSKKGNELRLCPSLGQRVVATALAVHPDELVSTSQLREFARKRKR